LHENGRIIIEVPNIASYGFRKFGPDWFYLQREHLYYFKQKSLLALLENTGYKVEKCYSFGGFYVTKGRSGRDKMLAIPSGLKKPLIRVYLLICDLFGRHDFIGVVARK
jgi:hypothetical protein